MSPTSPAREDVRRRGPLSPRRVVVGVLATPALFAWYVTAGGGAAGAGAAFLTIVLVSAALAAATVATYVPARGESRRSALGCGPCDVVAGASVLAAPLLLSFDPLSASMAVVAVAATAFGLFQRRTTSASTCSVT
ncbi:hypothetical protein [Myceligenerans xiligouense]|uniref:Uncharacterized protein n=1 Tax=Myceligenerans xiligouense TaxID=253184 RepID=A0A3N4YN61_9MICO|nr:hypothetical protein [Myceligenerans xiligouense]RPF20774.1 hypothetical protein EDD34_1379 [Myceligenerans xiligouense]